MLIWQFLCVVGVAFVILEIFTPSMFFLNFALASFITSAISLFVINKFYLVLVFFVLSFLSFAFLRPILLRKTSKDTETGLNSKYIGQVVKAVEDISSSTGVINIYGERWEARSKGENVIPAGSEVKILKNDGIIMIVEKM